MVFENFSGGGVSKYLHTQNYLLAVCTIFNILPHKEGILSFAVAQLLDRWTTDPSVPGSIPVQCVLSKDWNFSLK